MDRSTENAQTGNDQHDEQPRDAKPDGTNAMGKWRKGLMERQRHWGGTRVGTREVAREAKMEARGATHTFNKGMQQHGIRFAEDVAACTLAASAQLTSTRPSASSATYRDI